FCKHYWQRFILVPSVPLYHYTTGENLVSIVESGKLWSTQIACLNDAQEVLYAADQLSKRVKTRRANNNDMAIEKLLGSLEEALANPNVETAPFFVTCFSEKGDDLSQWRAYCPSGNGYAIQFDAGALRKLTGSNQVFLVRVEYNEQNHNVMFDDVMRWAEAYFQKWDGKAKASSIDDWAKEFVQFFLWNVSFLAPCIKHPAFKDEAEWRLVYSYAADDKTRMRFRQSGSMMTRHMPLRLEGQLPITGAVIGPCKYPLQSKVAVADLFKNAGYDPNLMKIEPTIVPYRA
ncbi:MAG: DUF2971 domain-containing protein, partial [Alphaproteobacteria bacterium]